MFNSYFYYSFKLWRWYVVVQPWSIKLYSVAAATRRIMEILNNADEILEDISFKDIEPLVIKTTLPGPDWRRLMENEHG